MHREPIREIAGFSDVVLIQVIAVNDVTIVRHNGEVPIRVGWDLWWAQLGTIQRPPDYESGALTS